MYVLDSSRSLDENDTSILSFLDKKKTICLLNKSDLDTVVTMDQAKELVDAPVISFSAKKQDGMDALERQIKDMFFDGQISFNDEIYITNIRQKSALSDTQSSLQLVKQSILDGMPEDFFSIDLMNAYESLGKIVGESIEDDLVNEIFSKFCMGK